MEVESGMKEEPPEGWNSSEKGEAENHKAVEVLKKKH